MTPLSLGVLRRVSTSPVSAITYSFAMAVACGAIQQQSGLQSIIEAKHDHSCASLRVQGSTVQALRNVSDRVLTEVRALFTLPLPTPRHVATETQHHIVYVLWIMYAYTLHHCILECDCLYLLTTVHRQPHLVILVHPYNFI
jgi:hypothetical protein